MTYIESCNNCKFYPCKVYEIGSEEYDPYIANGLGNYCPAWERAALELENPKGDRQLVY